MDPPSAMYSSHLALQWKLKPQHYPKGKYFYYPMYTEKAAGPRAFHPCWKWQSETPWKHKAAPCPVPHTTTHPPCPFASITDELTAAIPDILEQVKEALLLILGLVWIRCQGSTRPPEFVGPCKSLPPWANGGPVHGPLLTNVTLLLFGGLFVVTTTLYNRILAHG